MRKEHLPTDYMQDSQDGSRCLACILFLWTSKGFRVFEVRNAPSWKLAIVQVLQGVLPRRSSSSAAGGRLRDRETDWAVHRPEVAAMGNTLRCQQLFHASREHCNRLWGHCCKVTR